MQKIFIIWYATVRPHIGRVDYAVYLFNQFVFLVLIIHLMAFQLYVYEDLVHVNYCRSFNAIIYLFVATNLVHIIYTQIEHKKLRDIVKE